MPRPAEMSRFRYWRDAAVDRATAVPPVARMRERVIAARAPEDQGPGPDGLPLPPARLRVVVDGDGDPAEFIRAGAASAQTIRSVLSEAGIDLEGLGAILDFGCGCGRVSRHWAGLNGPELHACDCNAALVDWVRHELPFVEARVNPIRPPAPYPSNRFDLLYAISVLTHLPEGLAREWMPEWGRLLKPGGLLLMSVHGDAYRDGLGRRERPLYDAGQAVVKHAHMPGTNACVAHHPHEYVTTWLLAGFDLLGFRSGAESPDFPQDVYLARLR